MYNFYNGIIQFYEITENIEDMYSNFKTFSFNFKNNNIKNAEKMFIEYCNQKYKNIHSISYSVTFGKKNFKFKSKFNWHFKMSNNFI